MKLEVNVEINGELWALHYSCLAKAESNPEQ